MPLPVIGATGDRYEDGDASSLDGGRDLPEAGPSRFLITPPRNCIASRSRHFARCRAYDLTCLTSRAWKGASLGQVDFILDMTVHIVLNEATVFP